MLCTMFAHSLLARHSRRALAVAALAAAILASFAQPRAVEAATIHAVAR